MKKNLDAIIAEQQKNFDMLLSLSQKQLRLLEPGEWEEGALEGLLKERTKLFEAITALDVQLRAAVDGHEGKSHPGLERLHGTVQEILEADAKCGSILQGEKSKVFEQMQVVNKGSTALKGYGKKGNGGQSRFVSRKM